MSYKFVCNKCKSFKIYRTGDNWIVCEDCGYKGDLQESIIWEVENEKG